MKQIKKKIGGSFSGGGETLEEHRKNGANLTVDVPYHYLQFFLQDKTHMSEISEKYRLGKMTTGEIKKLRNY